MDMLNVVLAVAVLFVMGVVFAVLLGVAAKAFAVEVDERVPRVRECLPGANCGGCGYPGCDGLAAAIVAGEAPVNGCPVGGAAAAAKIAEVMGVSAEEGEKKVAHVFCNGGCNAVDKANYEGLKDCNAALRVAGGPKACSFGCIGLGSCVKACKFDALHIVDGVAKVDTEKCVACGKCTAACPKALIKLVPESKHVHVNCVNVGKGPQVMKVCSNGCIGCRLCEKTCRFDAIHVVNGVAKIDYDKCRNCKMCTKVCPRGCIEPVPTEEERARFKEMLAKKAAEAKAKAEAAKAEAAAAPGQEGSLNGTAIPLGAPQPVSAPENKNVIELAPANANVENAEPVSAKAAATGNAEAPEPVSVKAATGNAEAPEPVSVNVETENTVSSEPESVKVKEGE